MFDPKIVRRQSDFDILPNGDDGPVFTFRYLSVQKFAAVADANDKVVAAQTTEAALDALVAVLRSGLKRWKNLKSDDLDTLKQFGIEGDGTTEYELPYKPDLIQQAVYLRDLKRLSESFMEEQSPTTKTLGNSRSPARSQQAQSVESASLEDAAT